MSAPSTARTAVDVVQDFLTATAAENIAGAATLLTDDIVWKNTGLPAIRGIGRVRRVLDGLRRPSLGFEVTTHHIAAEGPVVLTDRTDVLRFGPVSISFRVCGTFHLRDGRITVWDDHFDHLSFAKATIVGIVRALLKRR